MSLLTSLLCYARSLVEETAKDHDHSGALLSLLKTLDAHPVISSWVACSVFVLQVISVVLCLVFRLCTLDTLLS